MLISHKWPLRILAVGREKMAMSVIEQSPLPFLLCRHATAATKIAAAGYRSCQATDIILKGTVLALELSMIFPHDIDFF